MVTVSQLWIYPVKSLRGMAVAMSRVTRRGLEFDRRWMLVDATGKFMTQRSDGRLAQFNATIGEALTLSHQEHGTVQAPLDPVGPTYSVRVWNDAVEAIEASPEVSQWFSSALRQECRLVWMPAEPVRPLSSPGDLPGDHVSFADSSPILVASEASLESLNESLPAPAPMSRFRPNVVLQGSIPYAEDEAEWLDVGGQRWRFRKRCGRCLVTTLDPETGESTGDEPLRTLAETRRFGQSACFGAYYVPTTEIGMVAVGMPVNLA